MNQWEAAQCEGLPTNNPLNDEASMPVLAYRGVTYQYQPRGPTREQIGIKTSDYSHQMEQAQFQAEVPFYSIAYPYWRFPFHVGPYNQQIIRIFGAGAYQNQSNLGIVGRPRGISDYNTPLSTPYGVPPDELS